mgnify:CR=1 FL=1
MDGMTMTHAMFCDAIYSPSNSAICTMQNKAILWAWWICSHIAITCKKQILNVKPCIF